MAFSGQDHVLSVRGKHALLADSTADSEMSSPMLL